MTLPRVALTLGDPAGVGPELALAAAADARVRAALRLVLVGPASLRPGDVPVAGAEELSCSWVESGDLGDHRLGEPQAACGRAALEALRAGHELALSGRVAALVSGPVNKRALHLAGELVEGQTELLSRWANTPACAMMAIAPDLRVMLVTRHLSLREAIASLTAEKVHEHLVLLDRTLRRMGFAAPRLALAGLNPHAGEGGLFGSEEGDLLIPAADRARAEGLAVEGPVSPDAVFAQALDGVFDGVLALYHDQAFIPIKLLARDTAVTLLAGFPYLRLSPTHGTAFDIAGKGVASAENLVSALLRAAEWGPGWVSRERES